MEYTGTIVEESLKDNRILNDLDVRKVWISGAEKPEDRWHLYEVHVSAEQIEGLAAQLRPTGWYMHFWQGDDVIVVYPNKTFAIRYSDLATWEAAIEHGLNLGIPREQLYFKIEEIRR